MYYYIHVSMLHFYSAWLLNIHSRLLWLIFFGVSFAYFCYVISNCFVIYYSYPVATRIQVIKENQLPFPAVTLCNFNQFTRSYMEKNPLMAEVAQYVNFLTESSLNFSDPEVLAEVNSFNLSEVTWEASHKMDKMFRDCRWKSVRVNCSEYITVTATSMGYCFTFNSYEFAQRNERLMATRTGKSSGLSMVINIQQDEYYFQHGISAGIRVWVLFSLQPLSVML